MEEMEEAIPFRVWFRDNRKRLGLSQNGIARRLEITVATVQNWESGRAKPDAVNLLKCQRIFGLPVRPLDFDAPSGDSSKASKLSGRLSAELYVVPVT
jgi:transcriptional regulator with XRE-family HTH domain